MDSSQGKHRKTSSGFSGVSREFVLKTYLYVAVSNPEKIRFKRLNQG